MSTVKRLAMNTPARSPRVAMQARSADQDMTGYAEKYSCSNHQITYYAGHGDSPLCPVCDSESIIRGLRSSVELLNGQVIHLTNEVETLRREVDITRSMRDALAITDGPDLAFLKSVAYRWRAERALSLKVTHGKGGTTKALRGRPGPANGFVVIPRAGEPEAHVFTSIGGRAIAEYYDEGQRTAGPLQALTMLTRALNAHLTGGLGEQ